MPPKKYSQAVSTSQMSIGTQSSDEDDDDEVAYDGDVPMEKLICASMQYVLVHSSKPQLIKRLDWINTVLRPMTLDGRKHFPHVHKHVVKGLHDTFGYNLVFNEKQDGYILVNGLKAGALEHRPLTDANQYSKYALLMIILACLKRAGGEMAGEDFWAILAETFSIRNDESTRATINQHKIFGDVQKLIKTDFVKEGYLLFEQAKDFTGEKPSTTVKLGFRAQHEFPDQALEAFTEKIRTYGVESDDEENNNDAMEDD